MDQATLSALMKSYGAADNAENNNRIRQHYASDPTAADRRLYGVKGQSDESGGNRDALLDNMIKAVMQQTDATGSPQSLAPLPMVQSTSVPTRRNATAGAPQRDPRGTAPLMEPQMMPGYVNPASAPVNPLDIAAAPQAMTPEGGSWLDMLIPAIMASVAGGATALNSRTVRPPITLPEQTIAAPRSPNKVVSTSSNAATPVDVGNDLDPRGSTESRRPTNTYKDERASDVKNKPINMDSKKQVQGPYDGDATNVMDQMKRQHETKSLKSKVGRVTGRK